MQVFFIRVRVKSTERAQDLMDDIACIVTRLHDVHLLGTFLSSIQL